MIGDRGEESPGFGVLKKGSEISSDKPRANETVDLDLVGEEHFDDLSGGEHKNNELDAFEAEEVEARENLELERVCSVVESLLFSTDKPLSLKSFKQAFKGSGVGSSDIRKAIELLRVEYSEIQRGLMLEEVANGFQLRTKADNVKFLRGHVKVKPFKLSGPALEVLSIVAYKQPCIKHDVDEIRGVESGHLVRGLMEKGILSFAGKSDLPGKPMYYQTTRKFLEIFGLRNLTELPSLSEIDDLIPDGIGAEEDKKESLGEVADGLAQCEGHIYSQAQEELEQITGALSEISTTTDFFEREKQRMKEEQNKKRAQAIREAVEFNEEVSPNDLRWLERHEEGLRQKEALNEATGEREKSLAEETSTQESGERGVSPQQQDFDK